MLQVKSFIFLLSVLLMVSVCEAQNNKSKIYLEACPNYSLLPGIKNVARESPKLSYHINLKSEFPISKSLYGSFGVGYFNTGSALIMNSLFNATFNEQKILYNHNYILVPIGIKKVFKGFFLHPELGVAIHLNDINRVKLTLANDEVRRSRYNVTEQTNFRAIVLPVSLSLGKTVSIKELDLMYGLKGYASINSLRNATAVTSNPHFLGLGLFVALELVSLTNTEE